MLSSKRSSPSLLRLALALPLTLVLTLVLTAGLVLVPLTSATATRQLIQDPRTLLESFEPESSGHLAVYFVEDNQSPVSRILTPSPLANEQPLICDSNMIKERAAAHFTFTKFTSECEYLGGDNWKIPGAQNIDPRTSFIAGVISGIGNCQVLAKSACVSSIQVTSKDGTTENLLPISAIHDHYRPILSTYDGATKSGYPGGSSPWLWRSTKNGTNYLATGSVLTWYNRPGAKDRRELNFSLHPVEQFPSGTNNCGQGVGTASDFSTFCSLSFTDETSIAVRLRVPNDLSGWLSGRLKDPKAYIEKFDNDYDEIVIDAGPVETIIAGKWVKTNPALTQYFNQSLWWRNFEASPKTRKGNTTWPGALVDLANQSVKIFTEIEKEIGDIALANQTSWSISMRSQNLPSCSAGKFGIQGLVATNAALYSSGAPLWDEKTGTLQYEVAAPQLRADRTGPNIGNYGLSMPEPLFKCIYGVSEVPEVAEVSISYGGAKGTILSSVSLKSFKNWVYLSADNFTFSAPTISVRLEKSQPKTSGAPVTKKSDQPTASAPTSLSKQGKLTVIKCVKGATVKKIKGLKPKCPKGYRRA